MRAGVIESLPLNFSSGYVHDRSDLTHRVDMSIRGCWMVSLSQHPRVSPCLLLGAVMNGISLITIRHRTSSRRTEHTATSYDVVK